MWWRRSTWSSLALLFACGARTGLGVPHPDATAPVDAGHDAPIVDVVVPPDAPVTACFTQNVITLAAQQSPEDIRVDDSYVYWIDDQANAARRIAKGGSVVEDLGSWPVPFEFGMALDDSWVYAGATAIYRIQKASGTATLVVSPTDSAYGMAVDATTLYWAEIGGHVRSVPKGGGTPIDLAAAPGGATRVAVDASYVYYTTWYPPNGGVWRVPIGGGASVKLAAAGYADYIAIDATDVFWGTRDSPAAPAGIWKVAKGGGEPTILAPSGDPQGLVVDDTFAYWADFEKISKVPKQGGPTQIVAAGQQNARAMAIDAYCIYWTLDPIVGEVRAGPK